MIGLIPCLITWKLWMRRCKTRMEGKFQSVEDVFISIKFLLQQASINLSNKKPWTSQDEHILHMIEFPWTPVKVK